MNEKVIPESAIKSTQKCCETCTWVHKFEPREDEKRLGLVIGCKKPGYEGYSSPLRMACDGVFWMAGSTTQ